MMGCSRIFAAFLAAEFLVHAAVPEISGYSLTWSDDFAGNANALPSSSNWIITTGTSYPGGADHWGTGEVETYTRSTSNLATDGKSNLVITALKSASGAWTSAKIETVRKDFMAKAGGKMRIQASLNLPNVGTNSVGYWPAFWTLGSIFRGNYTNWPICGEFDIIENINGVNKAFGTLHCGVINGGPCNETNGLSSSIVCPGTPCQGNFHTYTLEVDRTKPTESMTWLIDGVQAGQVLSYSIPAATWNQTVHNPHFILLNLAIGGSFPNKIAGRSTPLSTTVSGGKYQIDYVAVYNTN